MTFAELSLPLSLPRAHWALSIDTGEHVPRSGEMMLVRNLHAHSCVGVIVSWADLPQGGSGHVNLHSPRYVQAAFEGLGYALDERLTHLIRNQSDVGEPQHLVPSHRARRLAVKLLQQRPRALPVVAGQLESRDGLL